MNYNINAAVILTDDDKQRIKKWRTKPGIPYWVRDAAIKEIKAEAKWRLEEALDRPAPKNNPLGVSWFWWLLGGGILWYKYKKKG